MTCLVTDYLLVGAATGEVFAIKTIKKSKVRDIAVYTCGVLGCMQSLYSSVFGCSACLLYKEFNRTKGMSYSS